MGLAATSGHWPHLVCAVHIHPCYQIVGAWGYFGDRRYQVTLFSGPCILQAPAQRFPSKDGSSFQGCHGYPPSAHGIWHPVNLLSTSSQVFLKISIGWVQSHLFPAQLAFKLFWVNLPNNFSVSIIFFCN